MMIKNRILIKKFFFFCCISTTGTLAQYVVLIALVELLAISPVTASNIGMVIGAITNYFLSRKLAFKSNIPHHKGMLRFFLVAAIGLLFNAAIMHAVVSYMPYLLAQIVATGIVLFWNFFAHHYWTFRLKQRVS